MVKGIARCLKIKSGEILFKNKNIHRIKSKLIAQEIAILPQLKDSYPDIEVETLVSFGRYPHLKAGKRLSERDRGIVSWAIDKTGLKPYRERLLHSLSGGERQRAWIAMALAQEPKVLLLDEPTSYLDISYQLELLELIKELNQTMNLTVVMVLHDINQAARYSDIIYALKDGKIRYSGSPDEIMNGKIIKEIFNIDAEIYRDQINERPYFLAYKSL